MLEKIVEDVLEVLRSMEYDDAFHAIIELDAAEVIKQMELYKTE